MQHRGCINIGLMIDAACAIVNNRRSLQDHARLDSPECLQLASANIQNDVILRPQSIFRLVTLLLQILDTLRPRYHQLTNIRYLIMFASSNVECAPIALLHASVLPPCP